MMSRHLTLRYILPVKVGGRVIDITDNFTFLGSNITSDGEVRNEVTLRIVEAFIAFGCLKRSIFQYYRLSVETKREIYSASNSTLNATLWNRDVDSPSTQCEKTEQFP